jgi:two-component system response regulator AtoC
MPRVPPDQSPTTIGDRGDQMSRDANRPAGGLYLLVVGGDQMLTHPLPPESEIVLGRDPACAVPLADSRISRRHARVFVQRGEVRIEDAGSTNGIRVGNIKLEKGQSLALPLGDSVRLGPYTLIVLSNKAPAVTDEGGHRAAVVIRDPSLAGKTELLERIAKHNVGVLIHGETGTGKEVLARTLHALSERGGELVAINCAALAGTLLESELFGYEKGAFTGAVRAKPGLLEVAGQGSVLLDEIGDLPLELQGKLLRALEARQVYRVGGVEPIELRARVIAASHRSLPELIARGAFREDLYFRLNGITLELLPLRERRAQIVQLAQEFLADVAREGNHAPQAFTPDALARLTQYDWPGNVRELRLVVARAALLAGGKAIDVKHVLLESRVKSEPVPVVREDDPAEREPVTTREQFLAIATEHRGNASAIARALSTSRSQVRRLASRFGVDLDQLRKP